MFVREFCVSACARRSGRASMGSGGGGLGGYACVRWRCRSWGQRATSASCYKQTTQQSSRSRPSLARRRVLGVPSGPQRLHARRRTPQRTLRARALRARVLIRLGLACVTAAGRRARCSAYTHARARIRGCRRGEGAPPWLERMLRGVLAGYSWVLTAYSRGTHGVLAGAGATLAGTNAARGTRGVLAGYSRRTHGVLTGYSRGTCRGGRHPGWNASCELPSTGLPLAGRNDGAGEEA
jgi:hypothetical protein